MASEDERIQTLGGALQELRDRLGSAYWADPEVTALQDQLRHAIGCYAAWSEDKPPMHQRARRAARYESDYAALLWPGRGAAMIESAGCRRRLCLRPTMRWR